MKNIFRLFILVLVCQQVAAQNPYWAFTSKYVDFTGANPVVKTFSNSILASNAYFAPGATNSTYALNNGKVYNASGTAIHDINRQFPLDYSYGINPGSSNSIIVPNIDLAGGSSYALLQTKIHMNTCNNSFTYVKKVNSSAVVLFQTLNMGMANSKLNIVNSTPKSYQYVLGTNNNIQSAQGQLKLIKIDNSTGNAVFEAELNDITSSYITPGADILEVELSADENKLAFCINNSNKLYIIENVQSISGTIIAVKTITLPTTNAVVTGIEFSNLGDKLFFSQHLSSGSTPINEISSVDLLSNPYTFTEVANSAGFGNSFIERAIDGYMYAYNGTIGKLVGFDPLVASPAMSTLPSKSITIANTAVIRNGVTIYTLPDQTDGADYSNLENLTECIPGPVIYASNYSIPLSTKINGTLDVSKITAATGSSLLQSSEAITLNTDFFFDAKSTGNDLSAVIGNCTPNKMTSIPAGPNNGIYQNCTSFNITTQKFDFYYKDASGISTLKYTYNPVNTDGTLNGTLGALTCIIDNNDNTKFWPSISGGVWFMNGANEIYPWMGGISYQLMNIEMNGDVLEVKWKTGYNGTYINYTYRIYISGRTLVVGIKVDETIGTRFTLDRTINTTNPKIIRIPYMSDMNVLLFNNTHFLSAYFDWENTAASELQSLGFVHDQNTGSANCGQIAMYNTKSNGSRNQINEQIFFTVSPSVDQVLPHLTNPVSSYKSESSSKVVLDMWSCWEFEEATGFVNSLYDNNINNLWLIHHPWQNMWDNRYPDVMPANSDAGGDSGLQLYSAAVKSHNDIFSLHENYVDMYPNSATYTGCYPSCLARDNQNQIAKAYSYYADEAHTQFIQSYLLKPTLAASVANNIAPNIHSTYNTNGSFIDVHSSVKPSDRVDFDVNADSSAMMLKTLHSYRKMGNVMRANHQGPISGEGLNHFLYGGYYDDFAAQVVESGLAVNLPLLVNFKLNEMHRSTAMHGLGYYDRFFTSNDYTSSQCGGVFSEDKIMTYMATELAYGNCSYIASPYVYGHTYNSPTISADVLKRIKWEYNHVYKAQKYYANAKPTSILYNDNASSSSLLIDLSTYIKKYPTTYNNTNSQDFMGQVKIEYDNGTIIYVNRHSSASWTIKLTAGGWYNYHVTDGNGSLPKQEILTSGAGNYILPPINGWMVFVPAGIYQGREAAEQEPDAFVYEEFNLYPNPTNHSLTISGLVRDNTDSSTPENQNITITDCVGRLVYQITVKVDASTLTHSIDVSNLSPGMYIIKAGKQVRKFIKE